jgi:O-antigen/teichoic acid export membrane protein
VDASPGRSPSAALSARRRLREHLAAPLFRNAYFLMLAAAVQSALGFPFWALAARQYSTETVGLASTVLAALMLVSGISQLGLAGVLVRYVPAAGAHTRRLVAVSYAVTAAASLAVALVAVAATPLWSDPLQFLRDDREWFLIFVCGAVVWTIFSLQDTALVAVREARWVAVENTVYALSKLALVVVFAGSFADEGIVLAWLLPAAVLVIPDNVVLFRRFLPPHAAGAGRERSWQRADVRRLALGNYVGTLLGLIGAWVLPIIVANEAGAEDAAYFFIPWTITMSLVVVALSVTTSMVVEASLSEERLAEYARASRRTILRLIVPLAIAVAVIGPFALALFGSGYADEGGNVMRLLAQAPIPAGIANVGLSLARVRHDGRTLARVQGTSAVLTVVLALLLVPELGIEGAALAWLASQLVAMAMTRRELRLVAPPTAP